MKDMNLPNEYKKINSSIPCLSFYEREFLGVQIIELHNLKEDSKLKK